MHACMHACIHHLHTHPHTRTHTHRDGHADMHACMHACRDTDIPAYLHTWVAPADALVFLADFCFGNDLSKEEQSGAGPVAGACVRDRHVHPGHLPGGRQGKDNRDDKSTVRADLRSPLRKLPTPARNLRMHNQAKHTSMHPRSFTEMLTNRHWLFIQSSVCMSPASTTTYHH